jgi:hypothetical protein
MDLWDVPDWGEPSEAIAYPSLQAAGKVGRKAHRKEEELLERLISGTVKLGQQGSVDLGGALGPLMDQGYLQVLCQN